MRTIEEDRDAPDEESFDEEAESGRSDEAPWEAQDSPHEGEEGQREDVA
jgi:hypothetical protein